MNGEIIDSVIANEVGGSEEVDVAGHECCGAGVSARLVDNHDVYVCEVLDRCFLVVHGVRGAEDALVFALEEGWEVVPCWTDAEHGAYEGALPPDLVLYPEGLRDGLVGGNRRGSGFEDAIGVVGDELRRVLFFDVFSDGVSAVGNEFSAGAFGLWSGVYALEHRDELGHGVCDVLEHGVARCV